MSKYPQLRLRRLRSTSALRTMMQETELSVRNLIYPIFVVEGKKITEEISSLPGVFRYSTDQLPKLIDASYRSGINALLLFGIPQHKDEKGSGAYSSRGVVQKAVKAIKKENPDMLVITDVCLCEYTSHGHCGMVVEGVVDNDRTLPVLAEVAISHAEAGADMVAPSDMMDGRVGYIRKALDEAGFTQIPIMAYAAKFASSMYGPFREAAACAPQFGDRRGYQMNYANAREALMEIELDIKEGADIVMVKPALPYLDIISEARRSFRHPLAAFNVSGEYAMVKAAARMGWLNEKAAVMEILTAIKRAGADLIITYHAKDAACWLGEEKGLR